MTTSVTAAPIWRYSHRFICVWYGHRQYRLFTTRPDDGSRAALLRIILRTTVQDTISYTNT